MTTYTSPQPFVFTHSAGMQTNTGYGYGLRDLRDALIACGFVQTADTGQVDLSQGSSTTVPPTLTTGGISGYIILRMNDALASSKPIFIKLWVWVAYNLANGTAVGGINMAVGEGSDGAGNLTGRRISSQSLQHVVTTNGSGTHWTNSSSTLAAGGSDGAQAFISWHHQWTVDTPNAQCDLISIERTRDANGQIDGEGVLFIMANASNHTSSSGLGQSFYSLAFPTNGSTPANSVDAVGWIKGVFPVRRKGVVSSFVAGNDVGPLPPLHGGFFPAFRHTTGLFLCRSSDIPNDTIFTMQTSLGARSFRQLGGTYTASLSNHLRQNDTSLDEGTTNRLSLAMLWE